MATIPNQVQTLIAGIIAREGGYTDHPSDRGGPTMFGITESVARREGYRGPMREMPRLLAEGIYLRNYYLDPGFDRVAEVSPAIAEELTDTGVNMGQGVAVRFLQRALNALNRGGRDYPDMPQDGRIGPATISAIRGLLRVRGERDATSVLLTAMNALQGTRYIEIAEMKPSQEDFVFGWFHHRVAR